MKSKKKQIILLVFLVCLLLVINYSFLDKILKTFLLDYETAKIDRIIDGDTIVSNKTSIRLLGINAAERGQEYYQEAKVFLEELILNKTVKLEFGKDKYDKYNRLLAYVFLDEENINLKLVGEGLANFYFPSGKDIYYENFKKAWEDCIKENINLCEKSGDKCAGCIEILEFEEQTVVFRNVCDFDCELTGWEIKDEGRKNFVFQKFILKGGEEVSVIVREGEDSGEILYWKGEDYVWTKTGDTLFLRDDTGGLVLWESVGY